MFGYWGEKIIEQKPLSIYSEVVDLNSFPLKSGDKIIKVNQKEVGNMCWRDVKMELVLWGDKNITVSRDGGEKIISFSQENINEIINRTILIDDIPFVIDSVLDGPAKNAGLIKGDVLTSVNGLPLSGRQQFVSAFQKNENKTILVGYSRGGVNMITDLSLPKKDDNNNILIGVSVKLPEETVINYSFISSFPRP